MEKKTFTKRVSCSKSDKKKGLPINHEPLNHPVVAAQDQTAHHEKPFVERWHLGYKLTPLQRVENQFFDLLYIWGEGLRKLIHQNEDCGRLDQAQFHKEEIVRVLKDLRKCKTRMVALQAQEDFLKAHPEFKSEQRKDPIWRVVTEK